MNSFLQRFLFKDLPFKGAFVVLTDAWQTIVKQKEYPEGVREFLGELLAANTVMVSNLKLKGKVTIQIQDNPKLDLIVSECSDNLVIRATAKFTKSALTDYQINYTDCLHGGQLVISIDAENKGKLYQSIIGLNKNESLAELLNDYMLQSEQVPSIFVFSYTHDKIVGFLLQQMPDTNLVAESEINRIFALAKTLNKQELLTEEIPFLLRKLFSEDDITLYAPQKVQFGCTCSREKVSNMLRGLGRAEVDSIIIEEKLITITCDFCNTVYTYDKGDIEMVFSSLCVDIDNISNELH